MATKLEEALKELNKTYGQGTVMVATQQSSNIEAISTGSMTLDLATGVGGLPRGRIVELIGPESSGKTTISLSTVANAQKLGKVAFIDMEHSLDRRYAKILGVDMDNLLISQPDYGEQALNIAKTLMESGEVVMVVIDSVAALVPKSEMDGDIGDVGIGRQARLMSQGCRMLSPIAEKNNCLLLFTNQIRMKVGGYGNPEVGAGGEALKYYASVRIDVRRKNEKDDERSQTNCKVVKNKVGNPFKEASFYIDWGVGINKYTEVCDLAIEYGIIKKGGAWFSIGDYKWQGYDTMTSHYENHQDEFNEIKQQVLTKLKENA